MPTSRAACHTCGGDDPTAALATRANRCDGDPPGTRGRVAGDCVPPPLAASRDAAPGGALPGLVRRYIRALDTLAGRPAACNRLHPIAGRCARWVLLARSRAGRDTFLLTHEHLGHLLDARRPDVTPALAALRGAGLVAYHRREVTVLDRPGLEAAACACYDSSAAECARPRGERPPSV